MVWLGIASNDAGDNASYCQAMWRGGSTAMFRVFGMAKPSVPEVRSSSSVPEVNTPAQGRQLQQQIQGDLNKAAQDQSRQPEQSVDRNTQ